MSGRTNVWAPLGRLREALAVADPGGLRVRQAARTMLAVLLALAAFWHTGLEIRLFAAVGAGFFLQCGEGKRQAEQQYTLLVSGLAMTALVGLGTGLDSLWWAQGTLLITVAFLAYWLRRFVPRQAPIPVFGFTLSLLATVLPGGWLLAGQRVLALGVALGIAFVVYFFVFPPNLVQAFQRSLRVFCAAAASELHDLVAGRPPGRAAGSLGRLVVFNQGLADTLPDGEALARIQQLLRDQYDTHQALWLLRDAAGANPPPSLAGPVNRLAHGFSALAAGRPGEAGGVAVDADLGRAAEALSEEAGASGPDFVRGSCVLLAARRLQRFLNQLAGDLAGPTGERHER